MVNAILLLAISLLGQSLMGEDSEQVITTLYVNNFKQEEQGCSWKLSAKFQHKLLLELTVKFSNTTSLVDFF